MRRTMCLLLGLGIAAAAQAGSKWTVPGWYQVGSVPEGQFLWKGPFDSEADCKATLPSNEGITDEDAFYECEYLGERPSYEHDD